MSYVVSPWVCGAKCPQGRQRRRRPMQQALYECCSRSCEQTMSTRDAERGREMGHSFVLSSAPFLSSPPFILFSVLLEPSAVAVGTVKKGGGDTLICQWEGKEGEHRALQLQQHRRRRRPTCPSHRDNDENVLHRPIHVKAEIQFLKEPRASRASRLLFTNPVLLRTSFANGVCVLWEGPAGHS